MHNETTRPDETVALTRAQAKKFLDSILDLHRKAAHQFVDFIYDEGEGLKVALDDDGTEVFANATVAFGLGAALTRDPDGNVASIANVKGYEDPVITISVLLTLFNHVLVNVAQNPDGEPFPARALAEIASWAGLKQDTIEEFTVSNEG